jgi:myo-inositol-1(or 4)-monophosphatase
MMSRSLRGWLRAPGEQADAGTIMDASELDNRLRVAEAVVREAGRVAADHFARRELLSIQRKGAQDLVSEADRACEDLIVSGLSKLFPEDGFLGEERGAQNLDARTLWIIDPIDGTHNFLTGIPIWCVSVGLMVDGELVLGIIYHPVAAELYSARKAGGAFLNGHAIKVSGETELTRARIGVGFSYRGPIADHVRTIDSLLSAGCEYLRIGSGALGLAYTAAGRFEGYWERHINSWDAAAGIVLVQEAGGFVSDILAGEGLTKGNELLAASPALAEPLKRLTAFGNER